MKSVGFNVENEFAARGVAGFLSEIFKGDRFVVACIGTDAVIGDSLGPLVGSFLSETLGGRTFVYGTFASPVTARDVGSLAAFLRSVHPCDKILAVDAAVGRKEEIGLIRMSDCPLKPGAGVEKNLTKIGDANVIGVVAEKTSEAGSLGTVRLSRVWKAASVIADGIKKYFDDISAARAG